MRAWGLASFGLRSSLLTGTPLQLFGPDRWVQKTCPIPNRAGNTRTGDAQLVVWSFAVFAGGCEPLIEKWLGKWENPPHFPSNSNHQS